MNKILAMREKRGEVWDKAKAFLNEHQDENGMLSPEDAAQYERMEQEVVDLGHAIEREERAAQMERELNAPTMAPLASRPEARPDSRTGRGSNEYKAAFWTAMRNRGGHLSVQNALQIGTDSEGGYLVPDEYERTLVDALREENRLRGLCKIIRTSSGDRKIPLVASHGTASWVEEEGTIPESDDAFGQITIGAHKIASMIKISDELLQDSVFDIENYIATEFARRVGDAEEAAFISGDGSGKPYGMLHSTNGAAAGVTVEGSEWMKQVQEALKGIGIPVMAGIWRATSPNQNPPVQYVVYSTTTTEASHQDDVTTSYRTYVYLNLWSDIDPTDMAGHIRAAMYAYGFAMVEESDKGYNQPAYDTATTQFTVQWTWCWREEVKPLAPGDAGL